MSCVTCSTNKVSLVANSHAQVVFESFQCLFFFSELIDFQDPNMVKESQNLLTIAQEVQDMIYDNLVTPFDLRMTHKRSRGSSSSSISFRAHVQNVTDFRAICALRETCKKIKKDVDERWNGNCVATLRLDAHIYHPHPTAPGQEEPASEALLPTHLMEEIKTVLVTDTVGFLYSSLSFNQEQSTDRLGSQVKPKKRSERVVTSVVQCSFSLSTDGVSHGPDLSLVALSQPNKATFELAPCRLMVRKANNLIDYVKNDVVQAGFTAETLFSLSMDGLCAGATKDLKQFPILNDKTTRSFV